METENIEKKEFTARLASGAEVPGTEEFEESGKNRPVKTLNTPEPAYGRGRRILRRERPCRQPPNRSLEIGFWSKYLSRIDLRGSFFSAWRVFEHLGRHLGGHGGSLGVILGVLGSILGALGNPWGLFW